MPKGVKATEPTKHIDVENLAETLEVSRALAKDAHLLYCTTSELVANLSAALRSAKTTKTRVKKGDDE
jgi:ABC-type cobalamin/Fe3+-siderophores transport system ATPase subunit